MIGYPPDKKAYTLMDVKTHRVFSSRHVTFDEKGAAPEEIHLDQPTQVQWESMFPPVQRSGGADTNEDDVPFYPLPAGDAEEVGAVHPANEPVKCRSSGRGTPCTARDTSSGPTAYTSSSSSLSPFSHPATRRSNCRPSSRHPYSQDRKPKRRSQMHKGGAHGEARDLSGTEKRVGKVAASNPR